MTRYVVGIDLGTTNSTIAEILWRVGDKAPEVRCLEVEQPTRQEPYWSGRAESLTKSVREWDSCGGADLIQVKEAGV